MAAAKKKASKSTKPKARYVVVRTYSAGVHVGEVLERDVTKAPSVIVLGASRRIWQWQKRFTLNEIAMAGVGIGSRVSVPVDRAELTGVIEVIDCSNEGEAALRAVPAHQV